MNANSHELLLKDEVYKIVGAAFNVCNTLGSPKLEWKRYANTIKK